MTDNICFQHLHWIHDEEVFVQRRIVCAANIYHKTEGGVLVIPCVRHANPMLHEQVGLLFDAGIITKNFALPEDQGFVDQYYNWWTRKDAYIIALAAMQINHDRNGHDYLLFSEGLY